jgi:hypothetical protein
MISGKEEQMNVTRQTIYQGVFRCVPGFLLLLALALAASPTLAGDVTPPTPIDLTANAMLLAGGAGTQTDPHISGALVSYTAFDWATIHYYDFTSGTDKIIVKSDSYTTDALSDVSGSTIVFNRNSVGDKRVMFSTVSSGVASTPQELAPLTDATSTSSAPEISIADTSNPSAAAVRLTNDGWADRYPAVSSDGKVVVWIKSTGTGSDVYEAMKNPDGTWSNPQLLTGTEGNESFPDTDGKIIVYGSDRGGANDIYFQPVGGGTETRLAFPGLQQNPNVSNGLIAFESDPNNTGYNDIYAYDTQTGKLYQITDTPAESERLNDISVGSDGIARVVWAAPGGTDGALDIYAVSFQVRGGSLFSVQALFDQSRSYKLGSVVPIRFQLLDAQGTNISSDSIVPTATGLVQKGTAAGLDVQDAGNSNPDSAFRYDSTLQGYVFNLSTKNLSLGTWELDFTVPGDASTYPISFSLR